MMSAKGFLAPDLNRRPRMTLKHKAAIFTALSAARDYAIDKGIDEVERVGLTYAELVVTRTLEDYPFDRSCHTCDHFYGATCGHWQQEVPAGAVEAGCDEHQEDGVPF